MSDLTQYAINYLSDLPSTFVYKGVVDSLEHCEDIAELGNVVIRDGIVYCYLGSEWVDISSYDDSDTLNTKIKYPTKCKYCGASMHGRVCIYCGTEYNEGEQR